MIAEIQEQPEQITEKIPLYTITQFMRLAIGRVLTDMPAKILKHKSQDFLKDLVRHWDDAGENLSKDLGHDDFELMSVDVFSGGVLSHFESPRPRRLRQIQET